MSSTIKKNLIGQRFGMLEVIDQKRENNRIWCLCKCDCGNVKWIRSDSLTAKNKPSRSCGCQSRATGDDLTGQKFGRLTAIRPTDKRVRRSIVWECRCDCGNIIEVPSSHLVGEKYKHHCGCLDKPVSGKYPKRGTQKRLKEKVMSGVLQDVKTKKWITTVRKEGKAIIVGEFDTKEEALKALEEALKRDL